MNDWYMWLCDLESDEKTGTYWFISDEDWLNYSYEYDEYDESEQYGEEF